MSLLLLLNAPRFFGPGTVTAPAAVLAGVGETLKFTGTATITAPAVVLTGSGTNTFIYRIVGAVTAPAAVLHGYETEPTFNLITVSVTVTRLGEVDVSVRRILEEDLTLC